MATSFEIVLRDLTTGAGRTGLNVKLYNHIDNFTDVVLTAVEKPGHAGVYEFTYDTFAIARYRLKVNSSWETSFSDDNGTWLYDGDNMMIIVSGAWDFKNKVGKNVANPVDDTDAVNKGWAIGQFYTKTEIDDALALKVALAGTQTITGLKNYEIIPTIVPTDSEPGVIPDPSEDGELIHFKYLNQVLNALPTNPYPMFAGVIRVVPGLAVVQIGRAYPSIKDAVAYAFTQTPAANKKFGIIVEGNNPGSEFINADAGSLKDHVHLIALGKHINIIIKDNTLSANTSINNSTLYFGAGIIATERSFNHLRIINCDVFNYRNLTIKNGGIEKTKCISDTGYKMKVEDNCHVEHSIFNTTPEKVNHTGAYFADEFSDYDIPADPTSGS